MKTTEKLDLIRDEIKQLRAAIRRFRDGPLNEKGILVLLQNVTKLPQRDIKAVLDGIDSLEEQFLKEETNE